MDDKKQFSRRLLAIGALFSLVLAAYFVTLFDAQIVHGAEYRARSIRANTKSETVVTSRGILTDRNGKALVTNRSVYTLELDTSLAPVGRRGAQQGAAAAHRAAGKPGDRLGGHAAADGGRAVRL